MRGVTGMFIETDSGYIISTHTPHARRDERGRRTITETTVISTHTPHARRDPAEPEIKPQENKISTHTPHARRDNPHKGFHGHSIISTHTPHARRDS